jgi:DNA-binding NarL/FixJ family response regulator
MSKLRVFLADDHAIVREGLKSLVQAQEDMEVVGEAGEGHLALDAMRVSPPDVAVLDISLPGLNGIQLAEQLRQMNPQIRIITLTVHEDRSYLRQSLQAGASGYVLKRAAPQELVNALRAVAEGGTYIDPVLTTSLMGTMVRRTSLKDALDRTQLSEREEEVVKLIAQGHSNKEIASRLALSTKTVETYKTRSLEKLGLRSRADIVRFAIQQGWLGPQPVM